MSHPSADTSASNTYTESGANTQPGKYQSTRSNLDIAHRKPPVGPFDKLPRYWVSGHRGMTIFQNIFSMVIPEGEKFFVRSVMRVKDQVKDPELLEDMRAFGKQEAYHAKAHIEFNNAIQKHGYDVDGFTRSTKRFFNLVEKFLPAKVGLALTVFLEHITALGAESAHRYPELNEDWPIEAKEFWEWHAIEEMEHKSVAFDVLTEVGGGYFTRVLTALGFMTWWTILGVSIGVPAIIFSKLFSKPITHSEKSTTFAELDKLNPGVFKEMQNFCWQYFLDYFKPGFHPWQKDHVAYIRDWREKNPSWAEAVKS